MGGKKKKGPDPRNSNIEGLGAGGALSNEGEGETRELDTPKRMMSQKPGEERFTSRCEQSTVLNAAERSSPVKKEPQVPIVSGDVEVGHWYLLQDILVEQVRSESYMVVSKTDVEKLKTR